ncbi:unnamed protein product [Rotaria sp. Silwood1]|nr:unnamed protein product [Rotaria sp. Silwood1]
MSNNLFSEYPSLFLTEKRNLQRVFLQNNQLTSLNLASIVLVFVSIDLSNNQISKITNNANINISTYNYSLGATIDVTNNSEIIDFTDAIYEMYGACYEIQQIYNTSIPSRVHILTLSFSNINFGTSKINCTCNQYYIQKKRFLYSFGNSLSSTYPLSKTLCTDQTLFFNNTNTAACSISSVNFTNTIPHLCNISPNNGNIILVNTTDNITKIYRYYLTQTVNNSYCLFTFYVGGRRVSIDCINESSTLTEISSLCSLPSNSIDLSNQSFWILNSNTFPCSSNNTVQNINLAYNQINTVTLTLSNWILIDLTSNNLPQLPYTLLRSNQNAISNTTINLENNPFSKTINGYHIINNYEKKSLLNGPVSTNIIRSNQMRFLLNDQIAQNYNACKSKSLNYLIDIFEQYFRLFNSSEKITNRFSCSNISSLTNSSPSNDLNAKDNGRVLAIVLGSLGFLLLLALIIAVSQLSKVRDTADTRLEERVQTRNIRQPYNLSSIDNRTTSQLANIHDTRDYSRMQTLHRPATRNRSSYYVTSIDLCQVGDNRRKRRPKEPPIDYDIT